MVQFVEGAARNNQDAVSMPAERQRMADKDLIYS